MEMTDTLYFILGFLNEFLDFILWVIFYSAITVTIINIKKKKSLKLSGWTILFLSILTATTIAYGSTVEQLRIVKTEYTIDLEDYSGQPQKFIIIADLHVGQFLNTVKLPILVNKINNIDESEYLFILGDSVNDSSSHLNDLNLLSQIDKQVIYIYGNHDYKNAQPPVKLVNGLKEKLEELNFTILDNKIISIREGENKIIIAGIKDLWSQEEDFSILNEPNKDDTVLLLSHNPDGVIYLDEQDCADKVDLVLSGHTHGGEIRLPYIGSLGVIPTELPEEYDKGYKEYKNIKMFITSGVGSTGTRVRLFNPPEIVILTIK